jgi:hypothetical protein
MSLILTANATMVAEVLGGPDAPSGQSVIRAIAATRSLAIVVDDTLRALVDQARANGRTWAEIGEVLHVTRQAAFQRFGGASRTLAIAEEPTARPAAAAAEQAISILEHFLDERWDQVRADFDARMLKACPVELLVTAHEMMSRQAGAFEELGAASVSVRHGYTVIDVPMAFEHGDRIGRVVVNADEQVSGFFILPPDAA